MRPVASAALASSRLACSTASSSALAASVAPFSRRKSATAVYLPWRASPRGVAPKNRSLAFTSAPRSTRSLTTSRCPFPAAKSRAVLPWRAGASTGTPASSRVRTSASWPAAAAARKASP